LKPVNVFIARVDFALQSGDLENRTLLVAGQDLVAPAAREGAHLASLLGLHAERVRWGSAAFTDCSHVALLGDTGLGFDPKF
jgi:hypothetical protein